MITDELLDFLRTQHAAGMSRDEMVRLLIEEGGWNIADVNEGFRAAGLLQFISPEEKAPQQRAAVEPVVEDLSAVTTTPEEMAKYMPPPTPVIAQPATPPPSSALQKEASGAPGVSEEHSIAPSALPDLSAIKSDDKKEEVPALDISLPGMSLEDAAKGVTEAQAEGSVHFDLARLEEVSAPADTSETSHVEPAMPEPAHGPVHVEIEGENGEKKDGDQNSAEKKVETKPMAEVWKKQAEGTSRPQEPRPKREYAPLQRTRTMSSDLLLRGKGPQLPAAPAVSLPEEKPAALPNIVPSNLPSQKGTLAEVLKKTEKSAPTSPPKPEAPASPPPAPQAEPLTPPAPKPAAPREKKRPKEEELLFEEAKGDKVKKVFMIVLWVVIALLIGGGAAFAYITLKGPDMSRVFTDAFAQFFAASSFSYDAKSSANLELSTANEGTEQSGSMVYDTELSGTLLNSIEGFGNGDHHIKFSGKLMTGNFSWGTDVESDVKLVGSSLYFHVLSYPEQSDLDPDTLKIYWIKVGLAEIADSLALSGVAAEGNGYGNFGGSSIDNTFDALLLKYKPFTAGKKLSDDSVNGVAATHMEIDTDPSNAAEFIVALYKKYTSKDLTLSDDQRLRLEHALAKLKGELWVDPKTKSVLKVALAADFDDDMIGVHVKGPFSFSSTFSGYNKPFSVGEPSPSLTLDELKTRLEEYKKVRDLRDRDKAKADTITTLVGELEKYKGAKGRYPSSLSDLYAPGGLATSTVSKDDLKMYFYGAYVKKDVLTRAGKCTPSSKICAFYHLGVNFEDENDPLLGTDVDLTSSEIRGGDSHGCGNETNLACFDVVSIPLPPYDTATGTPASATSSAVKK